MQNALLFIAYLLLTAFLTSLFFPLVLLLIIDSFSGETYMKDYLTYGNKLLDNLLNCKEPSGVIETKHSEILSFIIFAGVSLYFIGIGFPFIVLLVYDVLAVTKYTKTFLQFGKKLFDKITNN